MALTVRPADIIKAKVIDYLIDTFDGVVIGDEITYGSSRKIVDLLALYNGETYAIEIKSSKDDLRRFHEQVTEYEKIFDHTCVFTTSEHLKKIKELSGPKVSIFTITPDNTIEGELINKKNRVAKYEMLATINASYISRGLKISRFKDSDDIRRKAMKYNKEDIHSFLYGYFWEKCYAPYKLFLKERKDKTEIDDMVILSNGITIN